MDPSTPASERIKNFSAAAIASFQTDWFGVKKKQWRCKARGVLGWVENLLKTIAAVVVVASLWQFDSDVKSNGFQVGEAVFLGLIAALNIVMFLHKLCEKELMDTFFHVLHSLMDLVLLIVVVNSIDAGAYVFTYVFLMVLGELVRILFLFIVDDYTVIWIPRLGLICITALYAILYFLVGSIEVAYWFQKYW